MRQHWKKLGQIYIPRDRDRHPKLRSHAANPLPVHINGDVYRIFFSGRDESNRSSVGAVDIDIARCEVVEEHYSPFFEYGPVGSYFADGVSIGNCYEVNGIRYMLFMGWQNPSGGHWRGDIGRLIVSPSLELELDGVAPFMGCDLVDPISLSYPWVQNNPAGGFDMWYGSTLTWDVGNGEMLHVIQHASSEDGQDWYRSGLAVPYKVGYAQAFSRPTVVQNEAGDYEMWFSYRSGLGDRYRIGYAVSEDGRQWVLRLDDAGISTSSFGPDSEMIEYPYVFDHAGDRYMLYNGNGYGKTGIFLARMELIP